MLLFEIWSLEGYLPESDLKCHDPFWRGVERQMRASIRRVEEVGDDIVLPTCWRVGWDIAAADYGVPIRSHSAVDSQKGSVGFSFDHPIRTTEDLSKLRPRSWMVDREKTRRLVDRLGHAFGDILPIRLHGTTCLLAAMTQDAFRLIGNDNLLTWPYDEPDALHRLMAFLRDDRIAYYQWLEQEQLLGSNNNEIEVGSGSPGFTSALPPDGAPGPVRRKDIWIWMESQETVCVSPAMFDEFFLPYMAEVARPFGLVYYGCCEPVHDRWDRVIQQIPQIRAVSISPWCDMRIMAEKLGSTCVFSRKPPSGPISGATPDWSALEKDIDDTLDAARGCNLEILYRDVYRINGDRPRLRRWVEMVREKIG